MITIITDNVHLQAALCKSSSHLRFANASILSDAIVTSLQCCELMKPLNQLNHHNAQLPEITILDYIHSNLNMTLVTIYDDDFLRNLPLYCKDSAGKNVNELYKELLSEVMYKCQYSLSIGASSSCAFIKPFSLLALITTLQDILQNIFVLNLAKTFFYDKKNNLILNFDTKPNIEQFTAQPIVFSLTEKEGHFFEYIVRNSTQNTNFTTSFAEVIANVFNTTFDNINKIHEVYYEKIKSKFRLHDLQCPIERYNCSFHFIIS